MNPDDALSTATSPAWSEAGEDGSTGVDFLGTRAVNLAMLTRLTGPFNNVVVSARQHAIVCWAAWRYYENCRVAKRDLKGSEFRDLCDAVETMQLAGQRALGESMGGTAEGLGSGALKRLGDGPLITLRFKKYGRSHDNTSALAPVQYGPSAKPGSLDLLVSSSKLWWPTPRGKKLALALDPLLRGSASYDLLTRFPVPDEIELSAAVDLASHGLIIGADIPERPEREPYIAALFDLDDHPIASDHERRLTLALLLETVNRLGGDCGVAAIRAAFLSGCRPDGAPLLLPAYLRRTAARWQLLQLRQLQRYALESWLFWAEWSMPGGSAGFVDALGDALRGLEAPNDDLAGLLSRRSGEVVAAFLEHRAVQSVLSWSATPGPGTPWGLRTAVKEALADKTPLRAAPSVLGLTIAVLALSEELVNAQDVYGFAALGHRRRVSLLDFKTWWQRRAIVPLRDALVDFLEELVLQQHVAVAVSRFDDNQRRLRFSNDEAGWARLDGSKAAIPALTPDRIGALLSLMTDLALVDKADESFTVTDAGRKVLDQVDEQIARETTETANPPKG